jgi:glycosyltransferase involved in cell wall biosynthesis
MTTKTCVALCMPIGTSVHPLFFRAYRELQRDFLGVNGWRHFEVTGTPVAEARNMITFSAMQYKDVTHLLWLDADMVFPAHTLKRMLDHDLDIIGGLCFDRRHPYKPVLSREMDPRWGFDPGTYGWMFDYPRDKVIPVYATGGACLLIKREVFEKIQAKEEVPGKGYRDWWSPSNTDGRSEDLALCKRAREAGYTIYVDTGLVIGHVGEVVIDDAFAQRNRQFEYSNWIDPQQALAEQQAMNPPDDKPEGEPLATVVIPTYDQKPEFLEAAVASALNQSVPVEVVVVDDGSEVPVVDSDGGRHVVGNDFQGYEKSVPGLALQLPAGVRVYKHPQNQGISAALNTGIMQMRTDYFCWLSSDDLMLPRKIEFQLATMLAARSSASYHGYNLKLDNGNRLGYVQTAIWANRAEQQAILASQCAINGSTVMLHKSVFKKVGVFDVSFKYAQDWEMWCRIGRDFFWHGTPDKLVERRAFGNLTEAIKLEASKRERMQSENYRVRRMYSTPICTSCGEPVVVE